MIWKIVLGSILVTVGAKELFGTIIRYNAGEIKSIPVFMAIGCITIIIVGFLLVSNAIKNKKKDMEK